ncbi:MAG: hypothetical protein FWE33_00420 [Defluviitaleaceae bacterium]|nr:hypothetical protein [Defluviitaleaceae bacterium]
MKKHTIPAIIESIALILLVACNDTTQDEFSHIREMYGDYWWSVITEASEQYGDDLIIEHPVQGDIWLRNSVEDLAFSATHIVRAEVIDSRVELINTLLGEPGLEDMEFYESLREAATVLHTVYSLRVLESFQGNAEIGSTIEAMQSGGQSGNRVLVNLDTTQFALGDEIILFLRCFETLGFNSGPMSLVSYIQGIYQATPSNASRGDLEAFEDGITNAYNQNADFASIEFESVNPTNNLTLTVGDLMRIAEQSSRSNY